MAFMSRDKYPLSFEKSIDNYVNESYAVAPTEYTRLAKVENFPMGRTYRQAQMSGLGMMRNQREGEPVAFDLPVEGNDTAWTIEGRALGYQYTQRMMKDTLHPERIKKLSTSLGNSARFRQDVDWFRVLAQATSTSYRAGPDALALLANNHVTLKSLDTISNLASGSLSQTTAEAGFQYFMNLITEDGLPMVAEPNCVVVSNAADFFLAKQLFGQEVALNAGYGSTDMNRLNSKNGIVPSVEIIFSKTLARLFAAGAKLTPGGATFSLAGKGWFMLDKGALDIPFQWQDKFEISTGEDFNTGNALVKGSQAYGIGIRDYKAIYGYVG